MQSQKTESKTTQKSWKTVMFSWVKAFVVPFLLIGLPVGYDFGHHQYKDIRVIHPGQFENYSESDAVHSAWETGILFGLIGGVPAGMIGLAGYGCFILCRKRERREPRR